MPEWMITFLGALKERMPMVPRILLTRYADKENAIKAINKRRLYQYIRNRGTTMISS